MSRRVWLVVGLIVLGIGLAVGLSVWNAAQHYARGTAAMRDRHYQDAAREFSIARVLGVPYRDADLRASGAVRAAQLALVDEDTKRSEDRIVTALDKADTVVAAGDGRAVITALESIDGGDLQARIAAGGNVRRAARALAAELMAEARRALREGKWRRADLLATGLGVLDPSTRTVAQLHERATAGMALGRQLEAARTAARRGQWRTALAAALGVLSAQKGFPGAEAVVVQARRALAPRAGRTAAPAAAASSPARPATSAGSSAQGASTQTGGGTTSGGTTPVQPAQPPPP